MINKVTVAIPFYKNEILINNFIQWYKENPSEQKFIKDIIIINDYPEEDNHFLEKKCVENNFKIISNEVNIGYLKSANIAFDFALKNKSHLILLNSDTIPYANFISELISCFEEDPNLGIVSPRSNNATISNLYMTPKEIDGKRSIRKFIEDFSEFKKISPKVTLSPTVTGFCFCVRDVVLANFPRFDLIFNPGYEEENDYCLRVSERGFRIGISNYSFVAHLEGKSFGLNKNRNKLKKQNHLKLLNKFPFYQNLLDNYSKSLDFRCMNKISTLLENKATLLIDAEALSPIFNGTNKLIVELLRSFSQHGIKCDVIANIQAMKFHKLTKLPGLKILTNSENLIYPKNLVYRVGIRIGQPFNFRSNSLIPLHSFYSICLFFDTIAHDCPELRTENPYTDDVWTSLPYVYSEIFFISQYSKKQFVEKFGMGNAILTDALLPTGISNFSNRAYPKNNSLDSKNEIVFVFGNKFKHKAVDIALKELPTISNRIYYILSEPFESHRNDLKFCKPGLTPQKEITKIFNKAIFLVFPSFSEGFGYPILEALEFKKTIYCRPLPPFIEIYNSLDDKLKKYIKFVPNFSMNTILNINSNNNYKSNQTFKNYNEYAIYLLKNSKNKSQAFLYNQFKNKEYFLLLKTQSHAHGYLFKFLKPIYILLLKSELFRRFAKKLVIKV